MLPNNSGEMNTCLHQKHTSLLNKEPNVIFTTGNIEQQLFVYIYTVCPFGFVFTMLNKSSEPYTIGNHHAKLICVSAISVQRSSFGSSAGLFEMISDLICWLVRWNNIRKSLGSSHGGQLARQKWADPRPTFPSNLHPTNILSN